MDQLDEYEYDNKTISSAVRAYLGLVRVPWNWAPVYYNSPSSSPPPSKQLCEPLMTFIRHEDFIAAASKQNKMVVTLVTSGIWLRINSVKIPKQL